MDRSRSKSHKNNKTDPVAAQESGLPSLDEDLPGSLDYWRDRRVARRAFDGPDRRKLTSRRQRRAGDSQENRRTEKLVHRFRRSNRLIQMIIMSTDSVCLLLALLVPALTMGLFDARAVEGTHYLSGAAAQFVLIATFFLIYNWFKGYYSKRCAFSQDLGNLFKSVFIAMGLQAVVAGLVGDRAILIGLLSTWAVALMIIPFARLGGKRWLYNVGAWTRPTVIIGAGVNARKTAEAIQSDWLLGFNIVEFIDCRQDEPKPISDHEQVVPFKNPGFIEVYGHRIPIRSVEQLTSRTFQSLGNPHVVVATDTMEFWDIVRILYEQDIPYSSLTIAPSLGGVPMIGIGVSHVFRHDVLMLTVQNNLSNFIPRVTKRAFDLLMAPLILLALSPLLLIVALLVRATGKNIFYGHQRIGLNGRMFPCYKFRSMVNNSKEVLDELLANDPQARAEWEKDFKLKKDPRITRIGQIIRKTSIDELPQLWNVIRGDMSLVGPRPVVADELERYEDKQDLYHMVRPGITGLWQISGRNDVTYEERVSLDSWYSRNWSLWYDLVILSKTAGVVLKRSGAY